MPNVAVLLRFAKLCLASYEVDPASFSAKASELDFSLIGYVQTPKLTCWVCRDNITRQVVACFQGTKVTANTDFAQIYEDLDLSISDLGNNRKVYKPVWDALQENKQKILDLIAGEKCTPCGHSLGGWQANQFMEILRELDLPFNAAITYGAPKAGNQEFWDWLPEPVRVVNSADIAPSWPETGPCVNSIPFIWINNNTLSQVNTRGWGNDSIDDHEPENYVAVLQKINDSTANT